MTASSGRTIETLEQLRDVIGCVEDIHAPITLLPGKTTERVAALTEALAAVRREAARETQTCENCRFAGEHGADRRPCRNTAFHYSRYDGVYDRVDTWRVMDTIVWVPLTIHGQPFGCKGWHAKADPPSPGGETK